MNKYFLTGIFFTLAGAILFSTKAIMVKLAFRETSIDALSLLMLRMLFSAPFYLAVAIFMSSKSKNIRFTGKQWMVILLLGTAGYYLSSLFDFLGLQYVSAGLERLILFLYPSFVVLINSVVFKEKINSRQRVALLLTYCGIAIAYLGELKIDTGNPDLYWGSFLIFLCAITYSIYLAGSGQMIPKLGSAKFTAYAMLAACVGVFTHYMFANMAQSAPSLFTRDNTIYGFLLATICTVLPTFLIAAGMKRIGANNVAIVSSIGPVATIIQANLILGEDIFLAQLAGTVLVIAGVILIGWKRSDAKPPTVLDT